MCAGLAEYRDNNFSDQFFFYGYIERASTEKYCYIFAKSINKFLSDFKRVRRISIKFETPHIFSRRNIIFLFKISSTHIQFTSD